MSIIEKAIRGRIRFQTPRGGNLTIEDLWDLNLKELNETAKRLKKELRTIEEDNFLDDVSPSDTLTQLKFDVVLHVLNTLKEEEKLRKDNAAKSSELKRLVELLGKKQAEKESNLTEEEILAKIAELQK